MGSKKLYLKQVRLGSMNYIIRLEAIGDIGRDKVMEALEEEYASDTVAPMVVIQEVSNGQIMEERKHFFKESSFSSPD
tara:strand:+ start:72 stop:305 length:234 start_codon:yes stop_codon:yes gene_type:complete